MQKSRYEVGLRPSPDPHAMLSILKQHIPGLLASLQCVDFAAASVWLKFKCRRVKAGHVWKVPPCASSQGSCLLFCLRKPRRTPADMFQAQACSRGGSELLSKVVLRPAWTAERISFACNKLTGRKACKEAALAKSF